MTLFFRLLSDLDLAQPSVSHFDAAFYDQARRGDVAAELDAWLKDYAVRIAQDGVPGAVRRERMNAVNPLYVPRNYLAQEAIDRAEQGDPSGVSELLEELRRPYVEQPGRETDAARRPDWARHKAGCSMLSCSS